MRARRKSRGSSSRVRFLGREPSPAHQAWYRIVADHYDHLYDPTRPRKVAPFVHELFRRHGPVHDVLDVACGTFALDLPLVKRGYRVVGRDLSGDMLRVARSNLRKKGIWADLGVADMRSLRLGRKFDAILCLGTAFNYLTTPSDVRRAMGAFRRHLRPGGLVVLDLTNFDAFIDRPQNARAEGDYRAPDGTRIAIYAFNEQDLRKKLHYARIVMIVERQHQIRIHFAEAPMRIWRRRDIAETLREGGFRVVEWWGDLRLRARYNPKRSPRLVAVAVRT